MIYKEEKNKIRAIDNKLIDLKNKSTNFFIDFSNKSTANKELLKKKIYSYETDWVELEIIDSYFFTHVYSGGITYYYYDSDTGET
jgi:hypothetical protein